MSRIVSIAGLVSAFLAFGAAISAHAGGRTSEGVRFLVPSVTFYPGDEVTSVSLEERVMPGLRNTGSVTRPADVEGKIARRTLLRGQPIPLDALRTRPVVKQGRTYVMIYRSAHLQVSCYGVPLQEAAAGETINVRNPDTGVIVKARVGENSILHVEIP